MMRRSYLNYNYGQDTGFAKSDGGNFAQKAIRFVAANSSAAATAAGILRQTISDLRQNELPVPPGIQARPVFLSGAVPRNRPGAEVFAQDTGAAQGGARGYRGALEIAAAAGGAFGN